MSNLLRGSFRVGVFFFLSALALLYWINPSPLWLLANLCSLSLVYILLEHSAETDHRLQKICTDTTVTKKELSILSSQDRRRIFDVLERRLRELAWQMNLHRSEKDKEQVLQLLRELPGRGGSDQKLFLLELGQRCVAHLQKIGRAKIYAFLALPVTRDSQSGEGSSEGLFYCLPDSTNARLARKVQEHVERGQLWSHRQPLEKPEVEQLELFGLKLSEEISAQSFLEIDGRLWRLLFWQGFAGESSATTLDREWLESFAKQITQHLFLQEKVRDLQLSLAQQKINNEYQAEQTVAKLHDLRSPLASVRAVLEYLRLGDIEPEMRALCEGAMQDCERISEMFGNLSVDRFQLKSYQENRREDVRMTQENLLCHPAQMLREISPGFLLQAREKRLQLETEIRDRCLPWRLQICKSDLDRILSNMLSNALKYTEQGWVRIALDMSADGLELICRDSGPGIPRALLEELQSCEFGTRAGSKEFDFRADSWGLGLAQIQELAQKNAAQFSVSSIEGVGSELRVVFPYSKLVESAQVLRGEAGLKPEANKPCVVLVDDDAHFSQSFARLLEFSGYRVRISSNMHKWTEVCAGQEIQALLIDQSVGGARFFDRLEQLRQEFPTLRIGVMSGNDFLWRRQELRFARLNIHAFFLKPCSLRDVTDWLNREEASEKIAAIAL